MSQLKEIIGDKKYLLIEEGFIENPRREMSFFYNLEKDFNETRASCYITEFPDKQKTILEVSFQQFYHHTGDKITTAVMTIVDKPTDIFNKYKSYRLKHNVYSDSEILELTAVDDINYILKFKKG